MGIQDEGTRKVERLNGGMHEQFAVLIDLGTPSVVAESRSYFLRFSVAREQKFVSKKAKSA
jgi:hypothetical protein